MKNVITLGKLIRLLSSLPLLVLLSVNMHTKNTRNELARLVMGIIFSSFVASNFFKSLGQNHMYGQNYVSRYS